MNDFDQPISFLCAHNYYIAGVDSYHDNHHEDRRWSFLCCNSPGHYSGYCYITGYQNSWDGYMDFRAQRNREPMNVSGNHREDSNQGLSKAANPNSSLYNVTQYCLKFTSYFVPSFYRSFK